MALISVLNVGVYFISDGLYWKCWDELGGEEDDWLIDKSPSELGI